MPHSESNYLYGTYPTNVNVTCTFVRDAAALLNTELQPFSTGSVRKIIYI